MAATMQQQQQQAPAAGAAPGQQPGPNYPMASLYVGDLAPEVGLLMIDCPGLLRRRANLQAFIYP